MTRDAHLTFRLALGLVSLGGERLTEVLRASEISPPVQPPRAGRRHVVVGGLVAAATALSSSLRRARGWIPRRPDGRTRWPLRPIERVLASWRDLGRREDAAGRALAAAVLTRVNGELFNRMSTSEQLQNLIEEHSAGLTRDLVDELRDRTTRADDQVAKLVRSFRRRH